MICLAGNGFSIGLTYFKGDGNVALLGLSPRVGRILAGFSILFGLIAGTTSTAAQTVTIDANTYAFNTSQGIIYVELRPDVAPKTVANFLAYVNSGAYTASFFHRLQTGFILQGGGYYVSNNQILAIPQNAPVVSEYSLPNTAGTLAMATQSGNPNSATNQFFFNLTDNSTALGNGANGQDQTVFAQIVDPTGYSTAGASLAVLNKINADQVVNAANSNVAFFELPVINYTSGNVQTTNLVLVNSITQVEAATLPPPIISNLSASSISSGQSVTATITATGYASGVSVTFSCASLPTDATCAFSPNPATTDATGTATAALTLATAVKPAFLSVPGEASFGSGSRWPTALLALVLCILFTLTLRRSGRRFRLQQVSLVLSLGFLAFNAGCSGGGSTPTATTYTTPTGSYSITVTGTGGSRSSSATLALTVH